MLLNIKNWLGRKFRKMTVLQVVVFAVVFVLFAFYAFSILYAMYWCIITSLKHMEFYLTDKWGAPPIDQMMFTNYVSALNSLVDPNSNCNVVMMLINSIWYSFGGTIISIGCSTCMAYVVSKYKFPGRKVLYTVAIVIMTLPIMGTLPASYRLICQTLAINNSPLILLTFTSGFGMNFVILFGFFSNVSWSYAEAGKIDGAGDFTIFAKIMMPQAMPAITSLFVIAFIGVWNDYTGPYLYMDKMPTLSSGLYMLQSEFENSFTINTMCAALTMVMIPVLIIFLIFQETIMSNTVAGGLKG